MKEPPFGLTHYGCGPVIKTLADPAVQEEVTHKHEKRNRAEYEAIDNTPGSVLQDTHFTQEKEGGDNATSSQSSGNWGPDEKEEKYQAKAYQHYYFPGCVKHSPPPRFLLTGLCHEYYS